MPTLLGASVAGYRIEAVAGRGGMGVVYRARQLGLDRLVALKLIAPALADEPRFRARFVRESRIAASLDHPNVIPVYEAGEWEGRLFIAMRLVEGTDLAELIRVNGRLSAPLAVSIAAQTAAALDAAHARGLVHRDVKPANILLAGDADEPHVYLTDFGLAKRESQTSALTSADGFLGTPDFIAPEQVTGASVDARTDVYALGCVLFATLTGRPPFERESALAKAWAHVNDPPPRVEGALGDVIAHALAKRPQDRYASTGQLSAGARAAIASGAAANAAETLPLAADGTNALTREQTTGAVAGEREPRTARLARPRGVRLIAAGAAAAIVVAVVAVALVLASREGGRRPPPRAPRAAIVPPVARPAPPPAASTGDTVRCAGGTCRQQNAPVSPPIEGGPCDRAGAASGAWTRIDSNAKEPLLACVPSATAAAAATAVPDLAGARLDLAEHLLDRLGVRHDTSGGGIFGIVDSGNWTVCTTAPGHGSTVSPGARVKLFVDRAC